MSGLATTQKPLVSVVVPIYQIDRYLGTCIESIVNQTYRNIEIILVNDGSTDRCKDLCNLYASKDSRIIVVHKQNGGLVSARKAGLERATGEYVSYVDGDDWIGPGFIGSLVAIAVASKADMVCAGQSRDLFGQSVHFTNVLPTGVYEGTELEHLWAQMLSCGEYYQLGISTYVWNKLFRKEILDEVQPRVDSRITLGEDAAVTYPALMLCKRVAIIDSVAYHYRQREDSMLKKRSSFAAEARQLSYLYTYLADWAKQNTQVANLCEQVIDYVLSLCIMRSGGRLPNDEYSAFGVPYGHKRVVVCSAGTFGQQLVSRIQDSGYCDVIGWIDEDYWEYRRCCLDVDPLEDIASFAYDYVLIATVDKSAANRMLRILMDMGISQKSILTIAVPDTSGEKADLIRRFLSCGGVYEYGRETNDRKAMTHA